MNFDYNENLTPLKNAHIIYEEYGIDFFLLEKVDIKTFLNITEKESFILNKQYEKIKQLDDDMSFAYQKKIKQFSCKHNLKAEIIIGGSIKNHNDYYKSDIPEYEITFEYYKNHDFNKGAILKTFRVTDNNIKEHFHINFNDTKSNLKKFNKQYENFQNTHNISKEEIIKLSQQFKVFDHLVSFIQKNMETYSFFLKMKKQKNNLSKLFSYLKPNFQLSNINEVNDIIEQQYFNGNLIFDKPKKIYIFNIFFNSDFSIGFNSMELVVTKSSKTNKFKYLHSGIEFEDDLLLEFMQHTLNYKNKIINSEKQLDEIGIKYTKKLNQYQFDFDAFIKKITILDNAKNF